MVEKVHDSPCCWSDGESTRTGPASPIRRRRISMILSKSIILPEFKNRVPQIIFGRPSSSGSGSRGWQGSALGRITCSCVLSRIRVSSDRLGMSAMIFLAGYPLYQAEPFTS